MMNGLNQKILKFDNLSIEDNNSNVLLVSFGGIKQGIGMAVYEFYNSLKNISCDKVFIKDINQSWYHKGINKEVKNIQLTSELLKSIILKKAYERVVFIGNSMGGYGAILFGVILNIDCVIAFSPQTFIGKTKRFFYRDVRWSKEISNVHSNNGNQKMFYNLKSFLKRNDYLTKINIYYSTKDKLDRLHSERLHKIKNVSLYPFGRGDHNLIKVLRDEDQLVNIVNNAINLK